MGDQDRLIQLVEQRPVLWDQSLDLFKDREEKERTWTEVATMFNEDWDQFDEKEQKTKIVSVKKMWRHIRDAYMKHIRPPKSGDPAPKRKKYVYAYALTFLKNSLEKRMTSGNFEDESIALRSAEEEASLQLREEIGDSPAAYRPCPSPTPAPSCKRKKIASPMSEFQSVLLEKISAPLQKEDADCKFLLSLHPKMAKLNESQKLDFQLHCLYFFKNL